MMTEPSDNSQMALPISCEQNASTPIVDGQPNPVTFAIPQRRVNRKYTCNDCNSYTFDPRIYLEHRQRVHCEQFTIHNCLMCNYASRHPNKVSRHMKMVHQLPADSLTDWRIQIKNLAALNDTHPSFSDSLSKNGPVKIFKCTICNEFETLQRAALLDHVRQLHSHVEIFNCETCNYSHYIKDRFRRHVKYHTMNKIRCQICDFETVYKWNMERHMKHHDDATGNIFSCDVCSYSATAKQSITAHKMTHHVQDGGEDDSIAKMNVVKDILMEGINVAAIGDVDSDHDNNGSVASDVLGYQTFVRGLRDCGVASSAENTAIKQENAEAANLVPIDGTFDDSEHDVDENSHSTPIDCLQLVWKDENMLPNNHSPSTPNKRRSTTSKQAVAVAPFPIKPNLPKKSIVPVSTTAVGSTRTASDQLTFSLDGLIISVFKCPHCPYIVQEPSQFHKHFITHSSPNQYSCSACGFSARFAWDIRRHILFTHKHANVLGLNQSHGRHYFRQYTEYAETLVISERGLDESTIVADINLKAKNDGQMVLLGQYLSLNAPLTATNEPALDNSLKNIFENECFTNETKTDSATQNSALKRPNLKYCCGICHQKSNWKHVIERHSRLVHCNESVQIEIFNETTNDYVPADANDPINLGAETTNKNGNNSAAKRRRSKSLDCRQWLLNSPKRCKIDVGSVENLADLKMPLQ